MRHEPVRRALRLNLLRSLAKGQRFRLRENIGQEHVVMRPERIERLIERNEVARYQPGPLMDELIERMLTVGPRLAPIHRPRRIGYGSAIERDVLSVALHGQLLQIGGKTLEVLLVWQHRHGL